MSWYEEDPASKWYLIPAKVDETKLAEKRGNASELKTISSYGSRYNEVLDKFFKDKARTTLKDEYASLSDEALTKALNETTAEIMAKFPAAPKEFPATLAKVVLKVKNNTWTHREKDFRVYDYKPYSDPNKWTQMSLWALATNSALKQVLRVSVWNVANLLCCL